MTNLQNIPPVELSIAIDDNPVAAAQTLTSNNTNVTNNKKVTIGTRAYTFKTTLTGAVDEVLIGADADATLGNLRTLVNSGRAAVAAATVLTSNNTNPTAAEQVVIGAKTYTFVEALTEVKASGVLTSDETNPADGDTVTIGAKVYTFRTVLEPRFGWVANEILIGATADDTLDNLKAAINGETGEQTKYSPGTTASTEMTSSEVAAHALTLTAIVPGVAGNSLAKAESSAHLDWDGTGAVMTGGIASTANEVLIGADANATLANLKAAVNGAAGAGTTYAYATVASTQVTAGAINTTSHTLAIAAQAAGIAGNLLASTDDSATLAFTSTVFAGGVDASTANAYGTFAAVASHAMIFTVTTAGLSTLATTTDETTLSWGAGTVAAGGSTIGTAAIVETGVIRNIVTKAPQLTGTPTYTVEIIDEDGDTIYISAAQNENATTRAAVEIQVSEGDQVRLTTSTKVEETLPFTVFLR